MLTEEEFARLKRHDPLVISSIIERFIPYVKSITKRLRGSFHYKADDILSTALLSLTEAVNKAADKLKDCHIRPYLRECVMRNVMKQTRYKDAMIPISQTTCLRHKKETPRNQNLEISVTATEGSIAGDMAIAHELWLYVARTPREAIIVEGLIQGQIDEEIAPRVGLSRQRVTAIRLDLRRRAEQWRNLTGNVSGVEKKSPIQISVPTRSASAAVKEASTSSS